MSVFTGPFGVSMGHPLATTPRRCVTHGVRLDAEGGCALCRASFGPSGMPVPGETIGEHLRTALMIVQDTERRLEAGENPFPISTIAVLRNRITWALDIAEGRAS